jgi:hypothetical protein
LFQIVDDYGLVNFRTHNSLTPTIFKAVIRTSSTIAANMNLITIIKSGEVIRKQSGTKAGIPLKPW